MTKECKEQACLDEAQNTVGAASKPSLREEGETPHTQMRSVGSRDDEAKSLDELVGLSTHVGLSQGRGWLELGASTIPGP